MPEEETAVLHANFAFPIPDNIDSANLVDSDSCFLRDPRARPHNHNRPVRHSSSLDGRWSPLYAAVLLDPSARPVRL